MDGVERARLVCIGVGSNLGDRAANVRAAIDAMKSWAVFRDCRASGLYETAPVTVGGRDPGGAYVNAAVTARTTASAAEVLNRLLDLERELGRDRATMAHGEARLIDLDLLMLGDEVSAATELTLPHPRMHERLFVLAPLAAIVPSTVHPVLGRTVEELAGLRRVREGAASVRRIDPAA